MTLRITSYNVCYTKLLRKLHFLTVRDGTGDMQAVVSRKAVGDEQFAISASLTQESSLIVTGQLRQDDRAPGGFELDVIV